ncbi:MAG: MBL fold metallo-hydrolase [Acidimicrobiia bacterium]|nr:MBL fold metallo-hydrolase [Acidimicrobiia bacterium]
MADLLDISTRILDGDDDTDPWSRLTLELSEVADGVAVIEAFSNVIVLRTDEGLVLFDTSHDMTATNCVEALRAWTDDPIHSIVYTHGHVDHVGGSSAFVADNEGRGPAPTVIGHANVRPRFDRYRLTNGYNMAINQRQFGRRGLGAEGGDNFLHPDVAVPTTEFDTTLELRVGDTDIELRHDRGETDDHAWAWIPEHRALAVGDLFIWVFPNAGNPQKVQRYPVEWAAALRSMAALEPELLLPAHGLPIGGRDRIVEVLATTATALEGLVRDTLELMNQGQPLDAIVHEVRVPDEVLALPYLKPAYDEPEFTVRNIWRLYGGWYDGNPARLKPPPDGELAAALAELTGGAGPLVTRARRAADDGELRLACALVELAVQAAPDDHDAHGARADIYRARRTHESSLMARGVFGQASRASAAIADQAAS